MKVHFGFVSTEEMKEKIDSAAKINKKTSSDIIREALNFYFQKQDEKEILKAILMRLDNLRVDNINLDVLCNRLSSFLNHYSEKTLSEEDNKKLRADVLAQINDLIIKKGYSKI